MYLSHFNLKIKPFEISTDPKFLWLGEKHQEALATLKYGILGNMGFLLLTGDVGTGKTTLINALLNSLGKEVIVATVPDPGLDHLDLFNFIAASFDINREFSNKGSFLVHFSKFLHNAHANGKKVLLIVDEAQRLTSELLEEIRLLSNLERMESKLINIFFVGQHEFNDLILEERNRAIRQRITVNFNIDPLTEEEIAEYISYRLKTAGTEKRIFSKEAVGALFSCTHGYPRRINVLCDRSLLTGYVEDVRTISPEIVEECAEELEIFRPARRAVKKNGISDRQAGFGVGKARSAALEAVGEPRNAQVLQPAFQERAPSVQNDRHDSGSASEKEPGAAHPEGEIERKEQGPEALSNFDVDQGPLRLGMGRFLVLGVLLVLLSGGYLVYDADTRDTLIIRVTDYAQTLGIYKESTPLSPPEEAASDRQSSPAAAPEMMQESADPVEIGQKNAGGKKVENAGFVFNDFNKIETVNASVSRSSRDRQNLASFQQEEPQQGVDDMPVAMPPEEGSALGEKRLKTGDSVKTESGPPPSYDFSKIIIQFNFNTNYPTNEAFATLNRLAELMGQHPHLRIIITGYTDN
ncbi:MAG: AAA family ATPase, partial [Desulfobulbaceae bacterium]|nr:AAA family ATPase [Desulfobulbaceae bacterium]